MKKIVLVFILFYGQLISAQVGINTTNPNAQLDVQSSNQAAPSNTDGILIPKIDAFPASNPTAAQQGMMVYLTTASGSNLPGFYYWDNATTAWLGFGNNNTNWKITGNSGTSAATNFMGTTDNTDLVFKRFNTESGRISSNNTFFGRLCGSVATGINNTYLGIEAGRDNVTGINNVYIGRRAGTFGTVGSDNVFIGNGAGILNAGNQNAFIGSFSGNGNSSGTNNSFFGYFSGLNNLTGTQNTYLGAFSGGSNTTGIGNTMIGTNTSATGNNLTNATAIGLNAQVATSNSIVLGSINGVNAATASTSVGIGTTAPQDRLHVVGNIRMVDGNQAAGKILVSDANGTASWTTAATIASGTLDQAYDFGAAGAGKTIIADSGAVTIAGEDGLVSTGTIGFGVTVPSGAGTRMVWNPRKAAFRAGFISGTQWDDINIGLESIAMGHTCTASGFAAVAIGDVVSAFGVGSTAFGVSSTAVGQASTVFGRSNFASASESTAFGYSNTASSYGETVLGIGATNYVPISAFSFGATTVTDRLFVIGNAIDTNNNGSVDTAERSDALVILKNGNAGLGSSSPQAKLHVVGNIRMVDGNQAAGKVLTSDANGTATWQNASDNAWGLLGNAGTTAATNFMGTTDNTDLVFKRFNTRAGFIGTTNTSFGLSALNPTTTGTNNTAIGSGSLDINTSGIDNMAAGFNTLTSNTTGSHNTTIGVAAMVNNSTGNFNTAIGRSALFDNSSGINNTGVGYNALGNVTTGTNNTAIGYNSFPGFNQGNNNTALGAETAASSTIFDNATAIGYRAMVGNSNAMVLGSINGVNGATSSVNVGIGTISPQTALEVVDSNVVTSASVEGTVNVMTNGAQAIDAGGSVTLGGAITDAGTTFRTFGSIEGRKANATTSSSSGYLLFKTNNAGALTERIRITSLGDVGIGTAAPGGQFELSLNEGRKPTSNTWTIPSDARLKNVNGSYEKGLAALRQLKPIRYHYKNTDKRTFDPKVLAKEAYGFLAQEVQPLFPEAVGTDPDGYLNFDLHPILIASVNAIKELDAKNKELQAENESLKAALQKLTEKVDFILNEMQKH